LALLTGQTHIVTYVFDKQNLNTIFEKPSLPSGFNLKFTCGLRDMVTSLFGKEQNKIILGDIEKLLLFDYLLIIKKATKLIAIIT